MNTKLIMILSSLFLGLLGMSLTFIPEEINSFLDINANPISILLLQLLGAIYLGFAIMNWMARGSLIGGIYSKPIVIGNLMHFVVSALALVKMISNIERHKNIVIIITLIYILFACSFGYLFKTNPIKQTK